MGVRIDPRESAEPREHFLRFDSFQKSVVLHELENILKSQAFRSSKRGRQFLSYVVEHSVEGNEESLKERDLGTQLFGRPLAYNTGDDPVVRVKASDVRRRLNQYYTAEARSPEVRIEIPIGSYIPTFNWDEAGTETPEISKTRNQSRGRLLIWAVSLEGLALIAVVALILAGHRHIQPSSASDEFWAPLLKTPQPVLVCLVSPIVYRPSADLVKRYLGTHPEKYMTPLEKVSRALEFDPSETVQWKDLTPDADLYVWKYDAYVAGQMSAILDRIGKPSQMRSANSLTFQDLRNSPVILIGAFNNRWTLQMAENLPYSFEHIGDIASIWDHAPTGAVWQPQHNADGKLSTDYAIASKVFDYRTGQPIVIAAGITPSGTEAAGEFLSHQDYLAAALKDAPTGWQKMNFEAVLQTEVTDGVAGPPQVVTIHFW